MEPDRASQAGGRCEHHGLHRHRLSSTAGTGLVLAGALGYIGLVDPHNTNSAYPLCPFKWLTGWDCPLCGGLRMTHDLLHGDLLASINDNIFLLLGIPMLGGLLLIRHRRGQSALPAPVILLILLAAIAWTVLRNLPGFPLIPSVLSG